MSNHIDPIALERARIVLSAGAHPARDSGLCAMEATALLAGVNHSDAPECTSQVVAAFVRHLNDHIPDERRQELIHFLPKLIGTNRAVLDDARSRYLARRAVYGIVPTALRHFGDPERAQALLNCRLEEAAVLSKAWQPRLAPPTWEYPAWWLMTYRAGKTGELAAYFSRCKTWPGRAFSSYKLDAECAEAAAGAYFQASRVGFAGAWDMALEALEDVLKIR